MQLTDVLSGSQLLFIFFNFILSERVYFKNMETRTFKEKMFVWWKEKLFCWTGLFLHNLCLTQSCESKIIGEMLESSLKNKSWSHLLEEIFQPPDSKSLRLRHAGFE